MPDTFPSPPTSPTRRSPTPAVGGFERHSRTPERRQQAITNENDFPRNNNNENADDIVLTTNLSRVGSATTFPNNKTDPVIFVGDSPASPGTIELAKTVKEHSSHKQLFLQQRIAQQKEEVVTVTFLEAMWEVIKLAVPIILGTMMSLGVNRMICMMMVGQHLSNHDVAVYGLGFSLYQIGIAGPSGFLASIDYFVSQAHGRGADKEGGEWIQTSIVFSILSCIPSSIFFFFFGEAFLGLFFESKLAVDLGIFMKFCTPFLLLQAVSFTLARGLQAHKRANLATFTSFCGTIFCVFAAIHVIPSYGVNSAVVVLCITMIIQIVATAVVCYIDGTTFLTVVDTWNPLNFEYWKRVASPARLKYFFKVGKATFFSLTTEWFCLELLNILAALLPLEQIAALGVVWIAVITLFFNVCLATGITASAFVGYHLGKNQPKHADFYSLVTQTVCGIFLLIDSLFFTLAGRWWFSHFVTDAETYRIISDALTVIIIFHNLEGWHISIQGIYRGCSEKWMMYTAWVVLATFWPFGLPAAYLFGINQPDFVAQLGLERGFASMLVGFALFGLIPEILIMVYTWRFNMPWKELALEASSSIEDETPGEDIVTIEEHTFDDSIVRTELEKKN